MNMDTNFCDIIPKKLVSAADKKRYVTQFKEYIVMHSMVRKPLLHVLAPMESGV